MKQYIKGIDMIPINFMVPIYNARVSVAIGRAEPKDVKRFTEKCIKQNIYPDRPHIMDETRSFHEQKTWQTPRIPGGRTITLPGQLDIYIQMNFYEHESPVQFFAVLAHECLHAALWIMEVLGLGKVSAFKNDETLAYLQQYIFEQTLERYSRWA